jgi:hypothetical protein
VDQTPKKIKDCWGNDSEYYKSFIDSTKEEYENSISYRFLYKFRNFCFHYSDPISVIRIPIQKHTENTVDLRMLVEKTRLLTFNSWGSFKDEIINFPNEIELIPHINNLKKCVDRIYNRSLALLMNLTGNEILFMNRLFKQAKSIIKTDEIAIIYKEDSIGKIQYFPVSFINEINRLNNTT